MTRRTGRRPAAPRPNATEGGYSLAELIVVVVIIGVLAAVAVPAFLSQQASAREAGVKSDLRAVAGALSALPPGETLTPAVAARVRADVRVSPGNVVEVALDASGARCLRGWHDASAGRQWVLDAQGLAQDAGRCTGAVQLTLP